MFPGIHLSNDLTWSLKSSILVKKVHQRLCFLKALRKLTCVPGYWWTSTAVVSLLTNCISVWYGNCSISDRKALQRVVKTAQRITGHPHHCAYNQMYMCSSYSAYLTKYTYAVHTLHTAYLTKCTYAVHAVHTSLHLHSQFSNSTCTLYI